jgi:hypothetical protein
MGLFLLFIVIVTYEFFGPIIETTLPNAFNSQVNSQGHAIISSSSRNFVYGILGLGVAYLFYIFIGGLPGQQEQYPL